MDFEQQIERGMFSNQSEKTYVDKLLAKSDVDNIRRLIKKPSLTRTDLLEILYLLSGNESKLLNYGEWDRYIILKYFVWIREFVKIAELSFDYQDDLEKKAKLCAECSKDKDECKCKVFVPVVSLSERTKKLLHNNQRLIEHNVKFLIDLYLNIGRTSLSLGATGLLELLKNKYEVAYPSNSNMSTNVNPERNGGILSLRR